MAEKNYLIPDNPQYNTEIRQLQDSDPASATDIFNPLIGTLIENTHAVKLASEQMTEEIKETVNIIDNAMSSNKQEIEKIIDDVKSITGICFGIGSQEVNSDDVVVSLIEGKFSLTKGATIDVLFRNTLRLQTAQRATLNVDDTGAKKVHIAENGYLYNKAWKAGAVVRFVYDGESWCAELPLHADTDSQVGVVCLTDYISDSHALAATPYCVKKAYDLADTANQKAKETENTLNNALNEKSIASKILPVIMSYTGYEGYDDILGLQVDYENKLFTRLAGAAGKSAGDDFDEFPMYGGMKRCNVSNIGTIKAYYGDSSFKEDGSNGQVMVYVPKFYYKVVPLKLEPIEVPGIGYHIRKANYYISATPKTGFKLHPAFVNERGQEVDYFLYSAYEGSLYMSDTDKYYSDADYKPHTVTSTDKMSSVAGKKPVAGQATSTNNGNGINLYRSTAETISLNRGKGWHCQTIKSLSALQFLMMIECGTLQLQGVLGIGVCGTGKDYLMNFGADTGSTSALGNKSGVATSTTYQYYDKATNKAVTETKTADNSVSVSYRGIENPYGNFAKWIQGVNVWGNGSMYGGEPYICDDFNFEDNKIDDNYAPVGFTVVNTNAGSGWISAFGYGNEEFDWAFFATEVNGTNQLPVGDSANGAINMNAYGGMVAGGQWNSGNGVGMFNQTIGANLISTYRNCHVGCRLIYLPQN